MRPTTQRDRHSPAVQPVSPAPQADPKRRRFLLALGAGSAAGGATAPQAVAAPLADAAPAATPKAKPGYRETEHVRNYYASTRI
jgi:hypothetical protein